MRASAVFWNAPMRLCASRCSRRRCPLQVTFCPHTLHSSFVRPRVVAPVVPFAHGEQWREECTAHSASVHEAASFCPLPAEEAGKGGQERQVGKGQKGRTWGCAWLVQQHESGHGRTSRGAALCWTGRNHGLWSAMPCA